MRWLAMVGLCLALASCGPPARVPVGVGHEVDALRAREMAYGAALQRHDEPAANVFCDACLVLEPIEDHGETHVRALLGNQTLVTDTHGALEFGYMEVELSGDQAVSYGECSVTRTSPATHQSVTRGGYCMLAWQRREDGVWRIRYESRNITGSGR